MPIEVDDLFLSGRNAIVGIFDHPHQVAEIVEADILGFTHGLDLDDLFPQVFNAREFVVGQAALRITAIIRSFLYVVGGNADDLPEHLRGEGAVLRREFRDAGIEVGIYGCFQVGHGFSRYLK